MRVLVAYASKYGATTDIAEEISKALSAKGLEVVVKPASSIQTLEGFDAAVVGSAVYAGHWQKAAKDLVLANSERLASMPVWLFSSGPIGNPPFPKEEPLDAKAMVEAVSPRGHRIFSGNLDASHMNFMERALAKVLRAKPGDYRDWPAIRGWAAGIADELAE